MSYWACASLQRVELGLHFLKLNGFETYTPLIEREPNAKGVNGTALLFPGYTFVSIELQWSRANRSPGVHRLIMDGEHPARVPDGVIADLRAREGSDGLIALPTRPPFQRGDRVRIVRGPFRDQLAIFAGMRPRERVEVLLALFGSERRLMLPRRDVVRA
jgi:transcriptional antiterminator RfaH